MLNSRLSIFLGLLIFVFLSGCGGGDDESATADETTIQEGINLIDFNKTSDGASTSSIPADDSASVKIRLLDSNLVAIENEIVTVAVTSGSVSDGPGLTNSNGEATFKIFPPSTLTSGTETGTMTITYSTYTKTYSYEFVASSSGSSGTTNDIASIQFVSAAPQTLSLAGTGGVGLSEQSKITFKVTDNSGFAIAGATLNFTLSTAIGGLSLTTSSASTNQDGEAFTYVQSGSVATPVRVTAFYTDTDGETISVQSDTLTVTSGIPDQNSFDLSIEKLAPEAATISGQTVTISARLADRFNNPVPDGTVVTFTAEGGIIDSSCQTTSGTCTVNWTSSDPRPVDNRITVMAYAIGNETFYDRQGGTDGVFDGNDIFDDLPEVFRDDDEDGVYNPDTTSSFTHDFAKTEIYLDYDGTQTYSAEDGDYNGIPCHHATLCPENPNNLASRSNLLTYVSDSITFIAASSSPNIEIYEAPDLLTNCLGSDGKFSGVGCSDVKNSAINLGTGTNTRYFWVLVEDSKVKCQTSVSDRTRTDSTDAKEAACLYAIHQSAPTESTIEVSTEVGELANEPETTIADTVFATAFTVSITSDPANTEDSTGQLEIKVTTPNGHIESGIVFLTDPLDP